MLIRCSKMRECQEDCRFRGTFEHKNTIFYALRIKDLGYSDYRCPIVDDEIVRLVKHKEIQVPDRPVKYIKVECDYYEADNIMCRNCNVGIGGVLDFVWDSMDKAPDLPERHYKKCVLRNNLCVTITRVTDVVGSVASIW